MRRSRNLSRRQLRRMLNRILNEEKQLPVLKSSDSTALTLYNPEIWEIPSIAKDLSGAMTTFLGSGGAPTAQVAEITTGELAHLGLGASTELAPMGTTYAAGSGAAAGGSIVVTGAALLGAFAAGYGVGTLLNSWLVGDTKDLCNSLQRQALDEMGLLIGPQNYEYKNFQKIIAPGTLLLPGSDQESMFQTLSRKAKFKGLDVRQVDKTRVNYVIFALYAASKKARGVLVGDIPPETQKLIDCFENLLKKGYLNPESWYAKVKEWRKAEEKEPKPDDGEKKPKVEPEPQEEMKPDEAWQKYIENTKYDPTFAKILWETWMKMHDKVGRTKEFKDWVKWYSKLRKDEDVGNGQSIQDLLGIDRKALVKQSTYKKPPGTHIHPNEVTIIMRAAGGEPVSSLLDIAGAQGAAAGAISENRRQIRALKRLLRRV